MSGVVAARAYWVGLHALDFCAPNQVNIGAASASFDTQAASCNRAMLEHSSVRRVNPGAVLILCAFYQ